MEQTHSYEGTPQQLTAWLRHKQNSKRYRIMEVEQGNFAVQERAAETQAIASAPVNTIAERPSALGKYAFVPGGSEEFARAKQAEIRREDKPL